MTAVTEQEAERTECPRAGEGEGTLHRWLPARFGSPGWRGGVQELL